MPTKERTHPTLPAFHQLGENVSSLSASVSRSCILCRSECYSELRLADALSDCWVTGITGRSRNLSRSPESHNQQRSSRTSLRGTWDFDLETIDLAFHLRSLWAISNFLVYAVSFLCRQRDIYRLIWHLYSH